MNGRYMTTIFLVLADCFSLIAVFTIVANIRLGERPPFLDLVLPCVLFVAALYVIEGYHGRTDFISIDYTSLHIIAVIGAALATLLIAFVFRISLNESRSVLGFG